jgi:Mor family transcriptional regulator
MAKKWLKPKLSIENAKVLRAKWLEGTSINTLCKQYDLSRHSVKSILKGKTYNKYGEHTNLYEEKVTGLF